MLTRRIKKLSVSYDLWGDGHVHALGEIDGREFQFRASAGEWELQIRGYRGFPSEGDDTGYKYGGKCSGTALSERAAAVLVEDCLRKHAEIVD